MQLLRFWKRSKSQVLLVPPKSTHANDGSAIRAENKPASIPDCQVQFVTIIQGGEKPFATMVNLKTKYNWALKDSQETLIEIFKPLIIALFWKNESSWENQR